MHVLLVICSSVLKRNVGLPHLAWPQTQLLEARQQTTYAKLRSFFRSCSRSKRLAPYVLTPSFITLFGYALYVYPIVHTSCTALDRQGQSQRQHNEIEFQRLEDS